MFFCFYLLYILNTERALLIIPASLFALVFLNLPTVHTYSTYILYVLCWSFLPLNLLMFFISTYCTYSFYIHTVSALLILPASLFAHVSCTYLLYFVETCSHFENYFPPQPKNSRSRLFICSCFFCIYLLYILFLPTYCTFSVDRPASSFSSCFFVSTYCTYLILHMLFWSFRLLFFSCFF